MWILLSILAATAPACRDVRLTIPNPIHAVAAHGAGVPAVVHNDGVRAVTLVMPGDGSEDKRRTPYYEWIVLSSPAGPDVRVQPRGICGNINPLTPGEVFTLEPGEQRTLPWIRTGPLEAKGTYRLRLILENDPDLDWRGLPLGPHHEKELEKVRASSPCQLEAEVEVISQ